MIQVYGRGKVLAFLLKLLKFLARLLCTLPKLLTLPSKVYMPNLIWFNWFFMSVMTNFNLTTFTSKVLTIPQDLSWFLAPWLLSSVGGCLMTPHLYSRICPLRYPPSLVCGTLEHCKTLTLIPTWLDLISIACNRATLNAYLHL